MALVMGIDLGTSSAKTIILDHAGHFITSATEAYPMTTPHPGWVEQMPEDWWRAVCKTIRAAIAALPPPLSAYEIKGIALSGQMNGALPIDDIGTPLRAAMLWLDGRSQMECDAANEIAGDAFRERALTILNPVNTLAKVLWLRTHEPDCYNTARYILIPKDWVRYKLTGIIATDVSDASVSGALDLLTRSWSAEILENLEVNASLFPDVLESTTIAGTITQKVSDLTGLAPGTPVCAGGGDMACMAVGSGAIKPGIVGVGIGTAGHAITFAETINDGAFNQVWPMCHSVPGAYFWLGCSYTGGASLSWLSEQFGEDYDSLTEQAAQAPPASDDLYFMPWLAGTGTPHPDTSARGGWLGLTLHHTKGHMVRALLEGVACDLRQSLDTFQKLHLPVDEIRLGEGGGKSPLWRQILVDVFAQNGRMMELGDASAIGAALIAGVGVGMFEDFDEACGVTIQTGEEVVYDRETAKRYEAYYKRYRGLYPALSGWVRQNTL